MRSRLFAPTFLSVIGISIGIGLLAGCSGSSSDAGTVPADADLIVTAEEGIRLDSPTYSTKPGDAVVAYVNNSSLPHNLHFVTADGSELPSILEVAQKGQTATKTVKLEPGTYTLICTIPGHSNMKATLTVAP